MSEIKLINNYRIITRNCFKAVLLFLFIVACYIQAFSQQRFFPVANTAPNIMYQNAQLVYTSGVPITTLLAFNTGGTVPASAYGLVGTFAGSTTGNTIGAATGAQFKFPTGVA